MFQTPKKYISYNSKKRKLTRDINKQLQRGIIPQNLKKSFLLQQVKYALTDTEVNKVLEIADEETFEFLIGKPIATSFNELSNYSEYSFRPEIEKELLWIERFLLDYDDEINQFIQLERQVENAVLLGNYQKAIDLLDGIDDSLTKSLWSIQKRLCIAEFQGGFQENKRVLGAILEQGVSALTGSIASYTSIRIESNISISQYNEILNEYIEKLSSDLRSYYYTKVNFFWDHNEKCAGALLAMDGTLSIIDRYKAFILAAQMIFTTNWYSEKVKIKTERIIADLRIIIDDVDLDNLAVLKEGLHRRPETNSYQQLLDAYTEGNYVQAKALAMERIHENAQSYPLIYILCQSLCHLEEELFEAVGEEDSIINQVIRCHLSILKKDDQYEESISYLFTLVQALGAHPMSIGLYGFLIEQLPYKVMPVNGIDFNMFGLLVSKFVNPLLYKYIEPDKRKSFLNTFDVSSPIVKFIESIFNDAITGIANDELSLRELKYFAFRKINLFKYEEALQIWNYILTSPRFTAELQVKAVAADIYSGKFQCLASLKKYVQAIEFAVDILIDEPKYENLFFNPEFIENIVSVESSELNGNIALPIFLKMYEWSVDGYNLYVAYDNFLCSIGCETPKDFFNQVDITNKRHITFLDKVCRHEVLYSSPYFKDQEELDLARIEICNFLGSRLPHYFNAETEVSDLLRKVVVRKGIKQIDYSKIYVDIKAIKATVNKELKENFLRNVEIASLPLDQLNKLKGSVEKVLVFYMDTDVEVDEKKEGNAAQNDLLQTVKLTSYDRFIHFKEAFLKIRDLFLFSADNGLDTYLSMRIRHGTLPGQIRSVFDAAKLITPWSDIDQQYLSNDYVLDKFNINSEEQEQLSTGLNTFSKGVDTVSEKLKTQIIQIKTEAKPSKGLFDYSYTDEQLLVLFQKRMGGIKDFSLFVDSVIDELWERTEINLQNTRDYLNTETTKSFNLLFDSLEVTMRQISTLTNYFNEPVHQEFVSRLRDCQTAIIVEIKKISEWFRRSNKKYLEAFDFSILLDSSVQALIRSFLGTSIKINNQCTLQIDGDYFPHFTDIVFYLLHNALKHSKLDPEDLQILIQVTNTTDRIIIEVRNNILNDEAYVDFCDAKVKEVKQMLEDMPKIRNAFSKEGGTGFPKIKKNLVQNLSREDSIIDLYIDKDQNWPWFVTTISFGFEGILKPVAHENSDN